MEIHRGHAPLRHEEEEPPRRCDLSFRLSPFSCFDHQCTARIPYLGPRYNTMIIRPMGLPASARLVVSPGRTPSSTSTSTIYRRTDGLVFYCMGAYVLTRAVEMRPTDPTDPNA